MSDKFDAKALQRLYEATTQGEWTQGTWKDCLFAVTGDPSKSENWNEICRIKRNDDELTDGNKDLHDAEFIVAIHNAFPAILAHIESLEKRTVKAESLCEKLKTEAQIHAQEARSQRATVLEGYQAATGRKGEPGDWHGAEPFKQLQRENAALREQDELHWKTRKTLAAENAALKNEVERAKRQAIIEDSYRRQFQEAWMESLARMEEESRIQIQVANEVKEGSWINEPRFAAFKKAYLKASGSTRAIPALAKCTPEEMYFAYEAIKTYEDYPPPEPQRSREREELVELLREQYEWRKQDGCSVDEYVNGTADALLAAGWRRK